MSPLSILLVEDDASISALLAEMLAELGNQIGAIQTTKEEAVAAAARSNPDLMIVDVRLAKGNGVSVVERITRAGPIPHVFMGGLGPLMTPSGAMILTKPFFEADLIRAIARALEQASISAQPSCDDRALGMPQTTQPDPVVAKARGDPGPRVAAGSGSRDPPRPLIGTHRTQPRNGRALSCSSGRSAASNRNRTTKSRLESAARTTASASHSKDITVDELLEFRRTLTQAGWSPDAAAEADAGENASHDEPAVARTPQRGR